MKQLKGFICGLLVGSIGITSVFAAGGIKSAIFNSNKVILDGKILDLGGQKMISVVKDGETNASNYMPVRGVLEALGYGVTWDSSQNAIILFSGGSSNASAISEPFVNTTTSVPSSNSAEQLENAVNNAKNQQYEKAMEQYYKDLQEYEVNLKRYEIDTKEYYEAWDKWLKNPIRPFTKKLPEKPSAPIKPTQP